jgi:hypothetical protein
MVERTGRDAGAAREQIERGQRLDLIGARQLLQQEPPRVGIELRQRNIALDLPRL